MIAHPLPFLLLAYAASHLCYSETVFQQITGETQHNYLRHTVALQNSAQTYGKQGHTLLSRDVVTPSAVWSTVDNFTRLILDNPQNLDWYIADVGLSGQPETVTINAGFSCMDRGLSNSEALYWWVSKDLSEATLNKSGVGGIEIGSGFQDGSHNDITVKCWDQRQFQPNRRLVEHADQHRGTGVRFLKPSSGPKDRPRSVVGDRNVFQRLIRRRREGHSSDDVVYDSDARGETGLGIVNGLPFDSGFRIFAPDSTPDVAPTKQFRVPMTPLGAINTHVGARLREARVDGGAVRTTSALLLFAVWSSGLPILLGVFIVSKTVSDISVEKSLAMRKKDVHAAVEGGMPWTRGEKVRVLINCAAVTILIAPIGLAVVEGHIDPRESVEITSGVSVFYTNADVRFTSDTENPIAGSIFVACVWITYRKLDSGHMLLFLFSVSVIAALSVFIVMRVRKKDSELMPGSSPTWLRFSLWKLGGFLRLLSKSKPGRNISRYKVLVQIRRDLLSAGGGSGEDEDGKVKEMGLMADQGWRLRASTRFLKKEMRHQKEEMRFAARKVMLEWVQSLEVAECGHPCSLAAVYGRVMLDDELRFKGTTLGSTAFDATMDRNWEYIRRGGTEVDLKPIEYYRTNGKFAPDEALVVVRMGLLKYSRFVEKITVADDDQDCDYDMDGVKCLLGFVDPEYMNGTNMNGMVKRNDIREAGVPQIVRVRHGYESPRLFSRGTRAESRTLECAGGYGPRYYCSYPASSITLKYFFLEPWDFEGWDQGSVVSVSTDGILRKDDLMVRINAHRDEDKKVGERDERPRCNAAERHADAD